MSVLSIYILIFPVANIVNAQGSEEKLTPLHMAVCSGDIELVQVLLDHPHINVDSIDLNMWTPLHHACSKGFSDIVIALYDKGANFCNPNKDGDYPLHLAAAHNHVVVFSSLMDHQPFKQMYMDGAHNDTLVNLKVK